MRTMMTNSEMAALKLSPAFLGVNTNKRGITINLKHPEVPFRVQGGDNKNLLIAPEISQLVLGVRDRIFYFSDPIPYLLDYW